TLANMEATDGSGQDYDDVFDGSQHKGSLAFTDPVPAGGETTYELAVGVPADELDGMHIKLTLPEGPGNGNAVDVSNQCETPYGSARLPETVPSAHVPGRLAGRAELSMGGSRVTATQLIRHYRIGTRILRTRSPHSRRMEKISGRQH